jgi:hypothetical protein
MTSHTHRGDLSNLENMIRFISVTGDRPPAHKREYMFDKHQGEESTEGYVEMKDLHPMDKVQDLVREKKRHGVRVTREMIRDMIRTELSKHCDKITQTRMDRFVMGTRLVCTQSQFRSMLRVGENKQLEVSIVHSGPASGNEQAPHTLSYEWVDAKQAIRHGADRVVDILKPHRSPRAHQSGDR